MKVLNFEGILNCHNRFTLIIFWITHADLMKKFQNQNLTSVSLAHHRIDKGHTVIRNCLDTVSFKLLIVATEVVALTLNFLVRVWYTGY